MIDPAWQGRVQFYELFFGGFLAYGFLVFWWQSVLKLRLAEWRYAFLTAMTASFFLINHYFQFAPFFTSLRWAYLFIFIAVWYVIAVQGSSRSIIWRVGATASSVLFGIVFSLFEFVARYGVAAGFSEFWFMLIAQIGYLALIWWRGRPDDSPIRS